MNVEATDTENEYIDKEDLTESIGRFLWMRGAASKAAMKIVAEDLVGWLKKERLITVEKGKVIRHD